MIFNFFLQNRQKNLYHDKQFEIYSVISTSLSWKLKNCLEIREPAHIKLFLAGTLNGRSSFVNG